MKFVAPSEFNVGVVMPVPPEIRVTTNVPLLEVTALVPIRPLLVSLRPLRSNLAKSAALVQLRITSPAPASSGICSFAPRRTVTARLVPRQLIIVPPGQVFAGLLL